MSFNESPRQEAEGADTHSQRGHRQQVAMCNIHSNHARPAFLQAPALEQTAQQQFVGSAKREEIMCSGQLSGLIVAVNPNRARTRPRRTILITYRYLVGLVEGGAANQRAKRPSLVDVLEDKALERRWRKRKKTPRWL